MTRPADPPSGSTTLGQIGARFVSLCGGDGDPRAVVEGIVAAGERLFEPDPPHDWPAAVLGASELLGALLLEPECGSRDWGAEELQDALEPVIRAAPIELDQLVTIVFVAAARNLSIAAVPPAQAIEAEVRLLRLCAPVHGAALLSWSSVDRAGAIVAVGLDGSSAAVQAAARRVLLGADAAVDRGGGPVSGIAVGRTDRLGVGHPHAALVVEPIEGSNDRAIAFAAESGTALARLLEREAAVDAVTEAALIQAQILRNRLHDGPLQSLALLSGEIQLLQSQVGDAVGADRARLLAGRLDDVLAQVTSVQRELRGLTQRRRA